MSPLVARPAPACAGDWDEICCEECGAPLAADPSPGVWVHDPDLGEEAAVLDEEHAARPPEDAPHPACR